jgi:hypothetical protein
MAIEVTRTYVGSIQNHQQVHDGLNSLGDSTSKIWNVARWTADRIWNATGEIPDAGVLKSYMIGNTVACISASRVSWSGMRIAMGRRICDRT